MQKIIKYAFYGWMMLSACGLTNETTERAAGEGNVPTERGSSSSQVEKMKKYAKSIADLQNDYAILATWRLAFDEDKYFFPTIEAAMSRYIDYRTSCGADWKRERLPAWFHVMSMHAEERVANCTDTKLLNYGVSNPHAFRQMLMVGNLDRLRRGKDKAPFIPDEKLLEFMTELAMKCDSFDLETPHYAMVDVRTAQRVFALYMYLNEVIGYTYPQELRESVYKCFYYMDEGEIADIVDLFFEKNMPGMDIKEEDRIDKETCETFSRKLENDINELYDHGCRM